MADAPRIVVALDPSVSEASAFDVLRYFRNLDADLAGVFVEDSSLLSHARSSLAREVDAAGDREFVLESLERQLRARSTEMRRYFESVAQALRGRHEFHVARGEVATEIERVAANCELLVVGVARAHRGLRTRWGAGVHRLTAAGASTTVFTRDSRSPQAVVTVVLRSVDDVPSVVPAALRVARTSHAPLRVLVVADGADSISHTRTATRTALAGFESPVRYDVIADRTSTTLESAVGAQTDCTLVLAAGDADADAELLQSLLQETTWNVMLVRS